MTTSPVRNPASCASVASLLDRPAPPDYTEHWTRLLAQPVHEGRNETQSAVVLRIGAEWFGLPTQLCVEVAPLGRIQSIPHRHREVILGLANVRGELVICASLAAILQVRAAATEPRQVGSAHQRLVVAAWADGPIGLPVDEVRGILRFNRSQMRAAPATVSQSNGTFSAGVLADGGLNIGLLDGETLRLAINRSLA